MFYSFVEAWRKSRHASWPASLKQGAVPEQALGVAQGIACLYCNSFAIWRRRRLLSSEYNAVAQDKCHAQGKRHQMM